MHFTREFIKSQVPGVLFEGVEFPAESVFSIDSRTLARGDIFVALRGERVDGHDFVAAAVAQGAAGLLVCDSRRDCLKKISEAVRARLAIAVVPDTYKALEVLATAWRTQFSYPVIGITGSVGKTTTKDMIAQIAERAGKKCLHSKDNQNTWLGGALNILRMRADHDLALFEMGINKRGEMARMAAMIKPSTAVITSIGHSHMEGLGSIHDIAAEKRDIFKYFQEHNIGIVHGDQSLLSSIAYVHPVIKFGCKMTNQVQARKIQVTAGHIHFVLKLYKERLNVTMPTSHAGMVMNGLAATVVAYVLGIPSDIIVDVLQNPVRAQSRFEKRTIKGRKGLLIDDCYNANPESMKAALLAFEKLDVAGKKIAILGDMLELGVNAPFWHRQLGRFLRKVPSLHHVVLVGEQVKWAQKTMPAFLSYEVVPAWKQAIESLRKQQLDGDAVVLVKGSNAVGLKNLVREVTESQVAE